MSALRLEVEVHIVTGSATAVQNLSKCVNAAGVKIDELVASALASADAVLSETEKELGVAVADIGAGTIDLAMFADGSPFRTAVLPIGGNNVTNDVAIGLKTCLQVAEELKIQHGTCNLRRGRRRRGDQRLASSARTPGGRSAGREVCQIIEARMRETFELMRAEMARGGRGHAAGRDRPDRRRGAARRHRRARPRGPRDAGPGRGAGRDRRARRHDPEPGLLDRGRAAPVGRLGPRRGRADALRVGAGDGRPRPAPGRTARASSRRPDPGCDACGSPSGPARTAGSPT